MSFQILDIALFSHQGQSRVLSLNPGRANVITGASKTGKSALIHIVDYCFGSSTCEVPEGIIRRTVQWYGLRLKLANGQAFLARRAPAVGAESSTEVYLEIANEVEIPDANQLRQTTNVDALLQFLSDETGIGPNIHEPPVGQTRRPLSANIRHALCLVFQPQDEIIQRRYLFHRQNDNWVAQAIKDTLPYFLGAVDDDYVTKKSDLRRLRDRLRRLERRLAQMENLRGRGLGKAAALISEARDIGIGGSESEPSTWPDAVSILERIMQQPAETHFEQMEGVSGGEEFERLQTQRLELQGEYRRIDEEINASQELMLEEQGFSREVREQAARLKGIGVLPVSGDQSICPICSSALEDRIEAVSQIADAVNVTTHQLDRVGRHSPQLQQAIDDLKERRDDIRRQLTENREALSAIQFASERLSELRDMASKRALVLGRISLYVESLPEVEDSSSLRQEIEAVKVQVEALEAELSDERIVDRLESILSIAGRKMTEWAQGLDLEHSQFPLRLGLRRLNVVADTDDGPVPMNRMGSGENWVGYHLIAHLALHEWFSKKNRPVPRFVFFDQPSQVYFPPERADEISVMELPENDLSAVKRMIKFVFDVVEDLAPEFQVIITEHADIDEDWFQNAVVERWRSGTKLVPDDWDVVDEN